MNFAPIRIKISLAIKKVFFWLLVSNKFSKLVRTPIVTTLVPTLTALYLTIYEIFSDQWAIFSIFPNIHRVIIYFVIVATIVVALFKAISDSYLSKRAGNYIDSLHDFIRMNATIVRSKDERFKRAIKQLTIGENIFQKITHPRDQINVILQQARDFLIDHSYLESEDNLRITIIDNLAGEWSYNFDTHSAWSQTDVDRLLSSNSCAAECLRTGEPRFLPDKVVAASNGEYLASERDTRFGNGSVYCYPVVVNGDSWEVRSIVTVITYNDKKLCNGYNQREMDRVSILLREICRRVELELTLMAIKHRADDTDNEGND